MMDLDESYERPKLSEEELKKIDLPNLIEKWNKLNQYVNFLESENEICSLKLKKTQFELAKLKNVLLMNYISTKQIDSNVKLCQFKLILKKKQPNLNLFIEL
jgi:hypothetical protein